MVTTVVSVKPKQKESPNIYIDPLTKFFVIVETGMGLNRLYLLGVHIAIIRISFINGILLSILAAYYTLSIKFNIATATTVLEHFIVIIFSYFACARLHLFYQGLNSFDQIIGMRPVLLKWDFVKAVLRFSILLSLSTVLIILPFENIVLIFLFLHAIEVQFYGQLLDMLTPRIRIVNYLMETSLSNTEEPEIPPNYDAKKLKIDHESQSIRNIMALYQIILKSFEDLVNAIKWQAFVIIILSFVSVLFFTYDVFLDVIRRQKSIIHIVADGFLVLMELAPLFLPCISGDHVYTEVRRLRELVASRLYENKMDKTERSIARALLSLTDSRDLSFSLFGMLDVDISLPFKFVGLLVTYLIILLQFDKVINPY